VVAGTTGDGAALASIRLWAWAQLATVVAGTAGDGATLAAVRLCAWAQSSNGVAGTTGDDAALPSVLSVGLGPVSHCGGGDVR
jgi:hypothetical protein